MDPEELRALGGEDPDQRRAEQSARDDDRDHEPVEDDVELVHELVQPFVDEADLDLAVADLLQHVVHLVRQLVRDSNSSRPRFCARIAIRNGEKRSTISSRAYGRATSKTLNAG